MMSRRCRSLRKSRPLSPPPKQQPPVANLRAMSRYGQCGPSTVSEASVHSSGPGRSCAILDYIGARSPQGAGRVQARIQAVIDLLLRYPGIGRRTNDPTIRRITATPYPYFVFYEVTETEVIIH